MVLSEVETGSLHHGVRKLQRPNVFRAVLFVNRKLETRYTGSPLLRPGKGQSYRRINDRSRRPPYVSQAATSTSILLFYHLNSSPVVHIYRVFPSRTPFIGCRFGIVVPDSLLYIGRNPPAMWRAISVVYFSLHGSRPANQYVVCYDCGRDFQTKSHKCAI